MDRFRIKRPGIQKPSQITKKPFANSDSVAEAGSDRTQINQNKSVPKTALLARRIPIDMSLPGDNSPSRIEVFIKQTKWRRVRKVATGATAMALVLAITLGGLLLSQNYLRLHKVFRGSAPTADALKPNQAANLLNGQSTGRVNVLLLGRDGLATYKNPNTTNTVMLASIDTINDTVNFVSIPSNLWVNVPNVGVMKMGNVWQTGDDDYAEAHSATSTNTQALEAGYKMVDSSVQQVLGLKVNYNVLVNLQALAQIINTVGGVTVNVPATLTDPTMAWQNHKNPVIAQAGTQTMSGQQALLYIMSKETTSDFSRDTRQRQVLTALFTKITSLSTYENPTVLDSLISTLGSNVNSDLSLSDAGKLYKIMSNINSSSVNSLDLTDAPNQLIVTGNVDGAAVDLPQAGLFNYSSIKSYISSQLKNPFLIKENAKILVLNGTNTAGLATSTAEKLRTSGFNVLGAANAPSSNWSSSRVIELNRNDKYTDSYLSKQFRTKSTNKLPNKSIPTDGADFVIILGSNEANNTQTQAN